MNCSTAQQHLSAFHDAELSPELDAALCGHIRDCAGCARSLKDIEELSRIAKELPTPVPDPGLWSTIEKTLQSESQHETSSGVLQAIVRKRSQAVLAVAATLLVGVSLGITFWRLPSSGHVHVGINFGRYLDSLDHDPDKAEQVLLSSYDGEAVSLGEATRRLRYQPVAPPALPDGKVREAIYLLKMPCCTCAQAVYRGAQGETVSIFEHADDQPIWFGDRPAIQAHCSGTPTHLVQVGDCLAASWQSQGRTVTVVGLRDVEQVSRLIALLSPR